MFNDYEMKHLRGLTYDHLIELATSLLEKLDYSTEVLLENIDESSLIYNLLLNHKVHSDRFEVIRDEILRRLDAE